MKRLARLRVGPLEFVWHKKPKGAQPPKTHAPMSPEGSFYDGRQTYSRCGMVNSWYPGGRERIVTDDTHTCKICRKLVP